MHLKQSSVKQKVSSVDLKEARVGADLQFSGCSRYVHHNDQTLFHQPVAKSKNWSDALYIVSPC